MRMATYDLDPDVTLLGLHLLHVTQYENAYVENDEALAHALQEEFTRVDSLEASGVSNVGEENMQASVLAQDWFGPSKRHYSTGNDSDKKDASSPGRNMEADDCSKMENDMLAEIGNFYSCFSPGEKSSYVEDFSNTLEITDEYGEVGTLTNNGITQYDRDMSQIEYVNEGYCENAYVENDEAVARALQEEFTRIDSLEASGGSNVGEENMQASVLAQDWFGPSKRHYSTGNDSDKKDASSPGRNMEADDCSKMENDMLAEIGNSYSCFSPGEKSSYVEDFTNALEITDEYGEVGKRLNQMIPVPVPKGLGKHVVSSKKAQANWYKKLLEARREAKPPPVTPEEAARLLIETLNIDQKADVEGLLTFYGLLLPHTLVEVTAGVPTSLPTGVKFEFETLPVDAKAIADGDGMTVYVSTTDPRESSCVPSDVQMAAVQRSEARAEKNYVEANALHKKITDSGYRVLQNFQNNEEILARKCRIRLRGIDAPENSMPYGEEAKKELTNIIQGRCLRVLVYGEDRYGRCVGDVYCNGEFVQELMLKKGLAWHYTAYDQRPELAKWEKEAQAKRVGLWASPNPEKPWEWRKDKRQVR